VFGETDDETGKKVKAALAADLHAVLCVGETLAQREAGETMAVVTRQLKAAFAGHAGKGRVDDRVRTRLGHRYWTQRDSKGRRRSASRNS